jgi:hypothetical protein
MMTCNMPPAASVAKGARMSRDEFFHLLGPVVETIEWSRVDVPALVTLLLDAGDHPLTVQRST